MHGRLPYLVGVLWPEYGVVTELIGFIAEREHRLPKVIIRSHVVRVLARVALDRFRVHRIRHHLREFQHVRPLYGYEWHEPPLFSGVRSDSASRWKVNPTPVRRASSPSVNRGSRDCWQI